MSRSKGEDDMAARRTGVPLAGMAGLVGTFALLVFVVMTVWASLATVDAGHVGVVTQFGQTTGTVLRPGLNVKVPYLQGVKHFETRVIRSNVNDASAASKDLQEVSADIVVGYRVNPAFVVDIFNTLGEDYSVRVLNPAIQEALKATVAQFTASELITRRAEVRAQMQTLIDSRVQRYNIDVPELNIVNLDFSREFNAAIEASNTARQKVIEEEQKLRQIEVSARQKIVEANAQAEATITRAKAESEANALINASLTDRVLQLRTLEKWNGILPSVTGGAVPFVSVPTAAPAAR